MIFLEAKGHAVDAIKAARWSDHPLGYPENWSSALRSNLYTILNSAAPKMLLWSDDLIVFFNDAYLKLTDGSDCSGLGASYPLLRPELWTSLQGSIEAALSGHGSITSEFRATAETTGSWSGVYQLCFSPVLDEQRIISGVLIDFVDLTVRKAREDKLSGEVELLTQLFRTTPVLISYCTGPELRIAYMNDALRRLFEGRPLVGSRLADAIPEVAEQGHLNRILEVLGSGVPWGAYELPLLIRSCEGTGEAWHYFDFACHPVTATG